MLRIHREGNEKVRCLRLEGKLLAPWVQSLRSACEPFAGTQLQLDLSQVTFVDVEGAAALREVVKQGAAIVASSPYVTALVGGMEGNR